MHIGDAASIRYSCSKIVPSSNPVPKFKVPDWGIKLTPAYKVVVPAR